MNRPYATWKTEYKVYRTNFFFQTKSKNSCISLETSIIRGKIKIFYKKFFWRKFDNNHNNSNNHKEHQQKLSTTNYANFVPEIAGSKNFKNALILRAYREATFVFLIKFRPSSLFSSNLTISTNRKGINHGICLARTKLSYFCRFFIL